MLIELPYPPSVNHYYRHVGQRVLISREGRLYREKVGATLARWGVSPLAGPLATVIDVYPPDRRRRDLDNVQKALLDALQQGGAYQDDSQITQLAARKCEPMDQGKVLVRVESLPICFCPMCGRNY